jgi:hypothetical protein
MSSRQNKLMLSIANDLRECKVPMSSAWLSKHNVSLDEMFDLCSVLANAIESYTRASPVLRSRLTMMAIAGNDEELQKALSVSGVELETHQNIKEMTKEFDNKLKTKHS